MKMTFIEAFLTAVRVGIPVSLFFFLLFASLLSIFEDVVTSVVLIVIFMILCFIATGVILYDPPTPPVFTDCGQILKDRPALSQGEIK